MKIKLIFQVSQDPDNSYIAKCLSEQFIVRGNTLEDLRQNIDDVVEAHFSRNENRKFHIVLRTQ
ncbi:MAG: hypothetical protein JW774_01050 [Candidatus Aureabacteria bacterium]|nr:hypothetical protein [Candidatus Auribacterota bacterium]